MKLNSLASASDLFASVVNCDRCTRVDFPRLLRDQGENVPQPGFIGEKYALHRVLLVGQNPGRPNEKKQELVRRDKIYTGLLRAHAEAPSEVSYSRLADELKAFIPHWPVHGKYFPLEDCGLTLDEIAYMNVVRCRTESDAIPGVRLVASCLTHHFEAWIEFLRPSVVVFIGKWAADVWGSTATSRGIPNAFMNRQRSLSADEREANRQEVIRVVQGAIRARN